MYLFITIHLFIYYYVYTDRFYINIDLLTYTYVYCLSLFLSLYVCSFSMYTFSFNLGLTSNSQAITERTCHAAVPTLRRTCHELPPQDPGAGQDAVEAASRASNLRCNAASLSRASLVGAGCTCHQRRPAVACACARQQQQQQRLQTSAWAPARRCHTESTCLLRLWRRRGSPFAPGTHRDVPRKTRCSLNRNVCLYICKLSPPAGDLLPLLMFIFEKTRLKKQYMSVQYPMSIPNCTHGPMEAPTQHVWCWCAVEYT